ncbi:MAG TPA: LON peptidase substrate-binding domain-containing protein [Actinomycetes bacterium]|nr:LON peptidase substrate-binding domain-containing protein [Actinomycetes bacterium]
MTVRIPLFPLGTVLFPGLLLPLHVFERRYRDLVRDLLTAPDEQRRFGVVAIREGREVGADGIRALYPVGCVARLRRVDPYDDGRFDIVSTGAQRFRLLSVDTALPYLRAEVDLLDEAPGEAADAAAAGVRALFDVYRRAVGAQPAEDLPTEPDVLSYLVAATMVLDLPDRQILLEQPDTTLRLRQELRLLRRETALLGLLPSLPGVELTRVAASPN